MAAGVSYREMLAEAGFVSAFIVAGLMVFELARVFGLGDAIKWGLIAALTIGYGLWSRSPGKPLFIVMALVMIPLAVTELGTDSWITSILTPAMTDLGVNAGWVLVYAMAIVLVLRLFAGPLVHRFSPLGLLAISALVAVAGLLLLVEFRGRSGDHRRGHGVQLRQGVLLADFAGRGVRAIATRWRHHAERGGRHRHAGRGRHRRSADRQGARRPDGAWRRGLRREEQHAAGARR